MGPLVLLIAAGAGWAWWTGRLQKLVAEDGVAVVALLLGLRFSATGRFIVGVPLIAGALMWGYYRLRTRRPVRMAPAQTPMPADDARRLLGLSENATLDEIRAAHRRLIARVHPDAGGSAELANRVNVARDTLIAEMNRRTPRAS